MMFNRENRNHAMSPVASAHFANAASFCAQTTMQSAFNNAIALILDAMIVASIIICSLIDLPILGVSLVLLVLVLVVRICKNLKSRKVRVCA